MKSGRYSTEYLDLSFTPPYKNLPLHHGQRQAKAVSSDDNDANEDGNTKTPKERICATRRKTAEKNGDFRNIYEEDKMKSSCLWLPEKLKNAKKEQKNKKEQKAEEDKMM